MIELNELAQLSQEMRSKKGLIDNRLDLKIKGHMLQYYKLLLEFPVQSEEVIFHQLYGNNKDKDAGKFRVLKKRLKDKLLHYISIQDYKQRKRLSGTLELNRYVTLAKIAFLSGKVNLAAMLAKQTLAQAKKFASTDVSLMSTKILVNCSASEGNTSMFRYYSLKWEKLYKLYRVEFLARKYYMEIGAKTVRYKAMDKNLISLSKKYYLSLKEKTRKHGSADSYFFLYRIGLIHFQLTYNYKATLNVITRFEKLIIKYDHSPAKALQAELNIHRIKARRYLGKYEIGLIEADKYSNHYKSEGYNWYKYHEEYFLLGAWSGNWVLCNGLIEIIMKSTNFTSQSEVIQDVWKLFSAYLSLLLPATTIGDQEIYQFLSRETGFEKDKKGFITCLKIIQILHFIKNNEVGTAKDMINSLRAYSHRNLRKKGSERTIIFCHFLQSLSSYDFKPSKRKLFTENYPTRFKASHRNSSSNFHTEEIIPYEILCEKILQILGTREEKRSLASQ